MLTVAALRRMTGALAFCLAASAFLHAADSPVQRGYFSYPAIHGETLVFTSEGDLWSVGVQGGAARRLTSNAGREAMATISPDGQTVAFVGHY
jgi:tricorn protease